MDIRVRYAPSPTGHLHIGGARTALFNFLYAKRYGGKFIIRIEDTDIARNVEGGVESQLDYLKWLGLDWDESIDKGGDYGPYNQLSRLDIYKKYADELLERGLAYKCYCTKEELEEQREKQIANNVSNLHYNRRCLHASEEELKELEKRNEYSIRFKVPEATSFTFKDLLRGEVTFKSEDIGDWVIIKNNGIPTYNFAVTIDDHLMKISHVLRGEEHLTNTPKQLMVYDAFGWDYPTFGHMTLIVNENNKKLSKRDESITQFIEQYKDLGYLPEGLFNFIALLGWSPTGKKEILSKEQIIQQFDANRLSKSPARFDTDKLTFINNRYMKKASDELIVELCKPHLEQSNINLDDKMLMNVCSLFKDRMSFASQIVDLYNEFIVTESSIDTDASDFMKQDGVEITVDHFVNKLKNITEWKKDYIYEAIKETGYELEVNGQLLYMPCRIVTTGQMHGPDLPKLLEVYGKERTFKNIEKFR